jgi:diguanylate cyclase (GGDEF)-like protein
VTSNEQSKNPGAMPLDGEVLVVDDDASTRTQVMRWLSAAGFVCAEATSGVKALEMLDVDASRYEAIVLDVMMPGVDGFEVLARMKRATATAKIPVLFLTASATEDDIVRGVEAGAVDYLLKPFSGPVLVAKLKAVRERSREEWLLRRKLERAERGASTDPLTGLLNRTTFDERLREMSAAATRHREALALLMLDIDHFKSVNDEFGHPAGDVALRFVADRIRRVLRLGDFAFRYGGEEFAVLLRKCDATGAVAVYDRLKEELTKVSADLGHGATRALSLSAGIATIELDNGFRNADLVARADAALYAAKRAGRDRSVVETASSKP